MKRGKPLYAYFLDLSKAFDLVPYDKLWTKFGRRRNKGPAHVPSLLLNEMAIKINKI